MTSLCVALLVKDEVSRFLLSWLEAVTDFADVTVALDDNSTDDTPTILKDCKEVHYYRYGNESAWGAEAPARRVLLELAQQEKTDWILVLDADMIPLRDPRPFLVYNGDAVAFTLYDLWSEDAYRDDGFWKAHEHHRIWMAKTSSLPQPPIWSSRGIHCGHLPLNFEPQRVIFAPEDYALLHYAYVDDSLRKQKHSQYVAQFGKMTATEIAHAESILDVSPNVKPLPYEPEWRLQKSKS